MSLAHKLQPSFSSGELSPGLYSRVDISKYHSGLKTARNVCILPQGGVRNRPGTAYVAAAGDSTHKVRVVPFVYSDGQAYVLEFGEGYIRFFTGGAAVIADAGSGSWVTTYPFVEGDFAWQAGTQYYCLVTHVSGTFATDLAAGKWVAQTTYEVPTSYLEAELFELKFTQSADYLFIFHPNHPPKQLVRLANNSWAFESVPFTRGPFMLGNTSSNRTVTPSAVSHSTTSINISYVSNTIGNTDVYIKTASAHGLSLGDAVTIASLDGSLGGVLNGTYTAYPLSTDALKLYYSQTRTFFSYPAFTAYTPTAGTLTKKVDITLLANFEMFDSLDSGALVEVVHTIGSQSVTTVCPTGTTTSSIKCGNIWRASTSGQWLGSIKIQMSTDNGTTWNDLFTFSGGQGGASYATNIETSGNTGASQCLLRAVTTMLDGTSVNLTLSTDTFDWVGVVKLTTISNAFLAHCKIQDEQGLGTGLGSIAATYQWAEGSWSDYRGWPTVGTFYQDRLATASTESEPQTVWFSQTGDYNNFGVSIPLVDSDAISAVLPSRTVNIVKNMVALGGLVVLTSDSDFSIQPGSSGALTPFSIDITCQGHRGTSGTTTAIVGNELILVQQMGSVVRNLIYQFSVNGYMGDNISVLNQHLFTDYNIVEMAYQQEPDSLVWAVRDDGILLSCSYMREQEVIAWTWHDTDGLFESVCCIPNSTLGINEIWVVVKRTIGGSTVRFIERLSPRDMGTDVSDYVILDCAVTTASSGTTVSGLSHLNGKTVNALADGNVVLGQVVTAGAITIPIAAATVHVGLPFISDVETLRVELQSNNGTSQGRKVVIPKINLRFWNSRGGYVGITSQDTPAIASTGTVGLDEIQQRGPEDQGGIAIPLKTQDYLFTPNGGYDFGSSVFFRQTDPLPFTLTGIIPQVKLGDN